MVIGVVVRLCNMCVLIVGFVLVVVEGVGSGRTRGSLTRIGVRGGACSPPWIMVFRIVGRSR